MKRKLVSRLLRFISGLHLIGLLDFISISIEDGALSCKVFAKPTNYDLLKDSFLFSCRLLHLVSGKVEGFILLKLFAKFLIKEDPL